MDFSEAYRYSGSLPTYSPDGKYLATAEDFKLVVRDVDTLQVVQLYSCLDRIQQLEWCCRSEYVLCGLTQRPIVQIWSVKDPDWTCKVDEGPAGVNAPRWSPDGQSIILVADFQIRMTIWSLVKRTCLHINGPKFADRGFGFSPDGSMMALIERHDCKDFLSLFAAKDWKPLAHLALPTQDAAGLAFSPDGSCFAVWDSSLDFQVLVYGLDGSCLASYRAHTDGLGIKSVAWSSTGQFLAVGTYEQEVLLLDNATWEPCAQLAHCEVVPESEQLVVYEEVEDTPPTNAPAVAQPPQSRPTPAPRSKPGGTQSSGKAVQVKRVSIVASARAQPAEARVVEAPRVDTRSHYVVQTLPARLRSLKPPIDKPNPKIGIGRMEWSADGKFLATRNDNMAGAVWVWDATRLDLVAVLQQVCAVRTFAWNPRSAQLAIVCATSRIFLWSPAGASCMHIPLPAFAALDVRWNRDGASLLVADRDRFCCAYTNT
ncbi:probable POC1 centriolar protein homolog A at N-terminal half [Coccomyxa sp. Obi]|nr:probable POC1 centriolar protein homolog A at N-terminal half [Coccomyxa sp. Obi]